MARLSKDNEARARHTMSVYPKPRSALIPLLHLVQEQDGYLTRDGMEHVAELIGITPAEVYGTASFYDMFFTHPVGTYLVSVCTNIACLLNGGQELLEHAEETLGVQAGATTPDGRFTLEEVECIALCGNAPCLAVNWRFFGDVTPDDFTALVDDLGAGRLADTVPPHGTLSRVRRVPALVAAGAMAGEPAAPPVTAGAAASSAAPQPTRNTGRDKEPTGGQATMAESAKQVDEIKTTGDTADEPQSGERE
jgi:NADH-quinone oxidoreductase subunit E